MEASREFVYQKFAEYYQDPSTSYSCSLFYLSNENSAISCSKNDSWLDTVRFAVFKNLKATLAETIPSDVYHSAHIMKTQILTWTKKAG